MTSYAAGICKQCSAPLPAVTLNQQTVTCTYCHTVQAPRPPPPEAWLAQHNELIAPTVKHVQGMQRLTTWMVRGYLLWIFGAIAIGGIAMLARSC